MSEGAVTGSGQPVGDGFDGAVGGSPGGPVPTPRLSGRWLLALHAAGGSLFAVFAWRYAFYLIDDAYISLRYARNLARGLGLVFNPGERVEGYTNFSWVLVGAGLEAAGVDAMRALQWLSVLCTLAVFATVWWLGRRLEVDAPVPPLVWLLTLEATGYWATTGMETALYALLLTLGVGLAIAGRRVSRRAWPLAFVALVLTRPDGALAFALTLGVVAWLERVRTGDWPWRQAAVHASLFAVPFALHLVWRHSYYGEWVPNTFYAKVTGGSEQFAAGLDNLGQWFREYPGVGLAVVASTTLFARGSAAQRSRFAPGVVAAGLAAYVVGVGGDFMPFLRFFFPMLPLGAVALSAVVQAAAHAAAARDEGRARRWLPTAVVGLLALHVAASQWSEEPYRAFVAHRTTVVGREVGQHFAATFPPGSVIAVNTAGSLPYVSDLPTIDMLGLTEPAIARHQVYVVTTRWAGHRRGWGAYVLSRRPRVIVWYNASGSSEPHYLGDRQLADDPYFRFFYQLRRATLPPDAPVPEPQAAFLGAPFGDAPVVRSPDLGVRFTVSHTPWTWTRAWLTPITVNWFERRADRDALWALRPADGDVSRFLDAVTSEWRRHPAPPGDPAAQAAVATLCARAREAIEQHRTGEAQALLAEAVERYRDARSPTPFQYIANLAALEGDLFLAVQAQAEALRLAPDETLFRHNLESLLRVPWERFAERKLEGRPER